MKNNWFFYFLKRSIAHRKGRFVISAASVMIAVAIITSLITLSSGVKEKLGEELRRYGANMIVTNERGGIIEMSVADSIAKISDHVRGSSYQLYGTGEIKGKIYEIIGAEMKKLEGYRLEGRKPETASEAMAGVHLRDVIELEKGDTFSFDEYPEGFTLTAYFERGSDEDSAIIMPLGSLMKMLGVNGVSAVFMSVDSGHIEEVSKMIETRYRPLEAKTLRQVAFAEEKVLRKIQLLMMIVTAVVLFSSVIALGSTMGANVIERMEEIGLMKAIGATARDIRNYFMSEAALAGVSGALPGYFLGIFAAEAVSMTAFDATVPVNAAIIFVSLAMGIAIAVVATYLPVRDAMKIVPAQIMRGE